MKESVKNLLVQKLNNGLVKVIENLVNEKLGVKTSFVVKENFHSWVGWVITLNDDGCEISRQLTATPLLSHFLKNGSLEVSLGYNEDVEKSIIRVTLSYNHPDGGYNGYDLLRFTVDKNNRVNFF